MTSVAIKANILLALNRRVQRDPRRSIRPLFFNQIGEERKLIAFANSPFAKHSGNTAANSSAGGPGRPSTTDHELEANSAFPNFKIILLFCAEWIFFKMRNHDASQIFGFLDREHRNWLRVFDGWPQVTFRMDGAALPVRLNRLERAHVVLPQGDGEFRRRPSGSLVRGFNHPQTESCFPVCKPAQPVSERIPVYVERERRNRIGFSHDRTSFTRVVRAGARGFNTRPARFILAHSIAA